MDVHYEEDGEILVDPEGRRWHELTGWLEPHEVRSLVAAGATVAIDECSEWSWDVKLTEEVMERVVTAEFSHRHAKKYPKIVILAPSLWEQNSTKKRLVVLSEEVPKKKKIIEGFRRPY